MNSIFKALSPLKVMDRKFADERYAIPEACPQIPQNHGVTLQYLGLFMLKAAPRQCATYDNGEEKIPALTEAQVMSPSKIFQTPGNKVVQF